MTPSNHYMSFPKWYYEPEYYTWSHTGTNTKLNRDKEIVYVPIPVYVPYPTQIYYPMWHGIYPPDWVYTPKITC